LIVGSGSQSRSLLYCGFLTCIFHFNLVVQLAKACNNHSEQCKVELVAQVMLCINHIVGSMGRTLTFPEL